jgi:diguanylate cyclase (GGDEF)-like protein
VQGQLRALNEELERKVEERTEALLKRAETDQLTGLLNRGAITRRFRELLALAQRGGRPLAVVLADGDNFKACNDVGGHPHGDRILQFLAQGLAEKSRETDYIGRMGGDEFLLLLPDTSAPGAVNLCRRVAEYIEKEKDRAGEGLPVPTLSFGIAVFPDCGNDADDLIRTADQAMYEAKREGGNRWRFSAGLPEEAKSESEVSGTTA